MATLAAPRTDDLGTDVYLALLAARAITGLADLADNPRCWNDRIREDLRAGVEFCRTVRAQLTECSKAEPKAVFRQSLRQPATDLRECSRLLSGEEAQSVESYIVALLARTKKPTPKDLLASIRFFVNASRSRQIAMLE